jgi:hypothetical protein
MTVQFSPRVRDFARVVLNLGAVLALLLGAAANASR